MLRALHGGSSRGLLLHGVFVPPLPLRIQQAPTRAARPGSSTQIVALKSSKGFGPPVSKSSKEMSKEQERLSDGTAAGNIKIEEVQQLVMDRAVKRIAVSLGIPLVLAVLLFPLFWYLKGQLGLDVPERLPLQLAVTVFGVLSLGITFGIVFTSWDPFGDGASLGSEEPNRGNKVKLDD